MHFLGTGLVRDGGGDTENEEGKKRGLRDEKERNMVPKREPKVDKNGDKNEANKR